jgi:hypothetical protein
VSENVKRVFAHPEDYVWDDLVTDVHRACWTEFVPASDYDALLAERDALREAGAKLEKAAEGAWGDAYLAGCGEGVLEALPTLVIDTLQPAVLAWRAATGEDA